MYSNERKIKAIEFALQYTPGEDDNHSHSVLLELIEEIRGEGQEDERI